MRTLIGGVAGAALLLGAEAAFAADIYKARPARKSDPCGVARFSGAYFGGNTGAVAYSSTRTDNDEYFPVEGNYSASSIGITGGLQAGYDWQSCNRVFGVVADFNLTNVDGKVNITPNLATVTRTIDSGMDWFGTLRARAGLGVNDALFYVTGGLAVAKTKTTIIRVEPGLNDRNSFSDTRLGLTGGFGAEFAFAGNWSANAEVLYMQFAQRENIFRSGNNTHVFAANDSTWVGRVGLNYRFDNPRNAQASAHASANASAAPVYPCAPARFSGGYAGGNIGGVSYTASRLDQDGAFGAHGDLLARDAGVTAGAQLGWDWQSCNGLLGIVADWNWSSADATARRDPNSNSRQSTEGSLNWFATLRGRAGLMVDDALIYVSGGAALAGIDSTYRHWSGGANFVNGFSDARWGLTAGVGAEFALSGNWSLNSELLYLQFAKDDHSFRRGSNTFSIQTQDSAWVSRVGLNYRWDNARNAYASTQRAARPCGSARFSGGYVGGTIGAIQRTAVTRDTDGFIFDTADWTAVNANVAGGVQAGYDWQSCGKVLGVVADLNITNAGTQSQVYPNGGNGGDYQSFMRSSMDWFSTLRTRGGVVVGDMLVYITGGVALADFDTAISRESGQSTRSSGGTLWGWTGGAGAEVALAGNWSVNGEMLYMQFAKETDTFRSGNNFRTFEYHDSAWIGRVGVTYRFGATPASAN